MFTKYHDKRYHCSYCEMLIGGQDDAKKHERIVHAAKEHIVECHCPVCKK